MTGTISSLSPSKKASSLGGADAGTAEADLTALINRYQQARNRRCDWEPLWKEAYHYALPQRNSFDKGTGGSRKMDSLYDATALDAVEQLAASLLGNLTPPWTQWFGFKPGPDLPADQAEALAPVLEKAAQTIQAHFDRSNFLVEMHQCFLDLVVGGTAALYVEEAAPGAFSSFNFTAVPLGDIILEEGSTGLLDGAYRHLLLTLEQIKARYSNPALPSKVQQQGSKDPQQRFEILEALSPSATGAVSYQACLMEESTPVLLQKGRFFTYNNVKGAGEA